MRRAGLLPIVLAVIGTAGVVSGQEPGLPPELLQVRQQIRELEARLAGFEQRQTDLAAQHRTLEGELRTAARHLSEWEAELRRAPAGGERGQPGGRGGKEASRQRRGAAATPGVAAGSAGAGRAVPSGAARDRLRPGRAGAHHGGPRARRRGAPPP